MVERVATTEQLLTVVDAILANEESGYTRDPERRLDLIRWLAELEKVPADERAKRFLPYLGDFDQNVRCAAADALAPHDPAMIGTALLAAFLRPEEERRPVPPPHRRDRRREEDLAGRPGGPGQAAAQRPGRRLRGRRRPPGRALASRWRPTTRTSPGARPATSRSRPRVRPTSSARPCSSRVHLVHQALPELAVADLDLSTMLCGRRLRAPILITGMTGGTSAATTINRDLAVAAAEAGVAMGVGSQRAMDELPELEATFQVKDVAPDLVLLGNLGVVQAQVMGPHRVIELGKRIGADAMAIHLNPAQEMIQERGDRDFRGAIDTIARLVELAAMPIVVKETGCGLSRQACARLAAIGVTTVDVSGAGGTSWVAVEAKRATSPGSAALGQELWDWGLPTAVATVAAAGLGLTTIASGGLRTGHDVARALALGARIGGLAAPALRAQRAGGVDGVRAFLDQLTGALRTVMLLCGVRTPDALLGAPRHLGPALRGWLDDLGLEAPGVSASAALSLHGLPPRP